MDIARRHYILIEKYNGSLCLTAEINTLAGTDIKVEFTATRTVQNKTTAG
jgi:hypothetical protein